MNDVSTFRLYLLRAIYLLIAVGLVFTIWPQILHHPTPWPLWHGVGCSLLGAVSVLAALGIRYPLKMLPVLFFEVIWKSIWLIAVALPLWSSHQMDAERFRDGTKLLNGNYYSSCNSLAVCLDAVFKDARRQMELSLILQLSHKSIGALMLFSRVQSLKEFKTA